MAETYLHTAISFPGSFHSPGRLIRRSVWFPQAFMDVYCWTGLTPDFDSLELIRSLDQRVCACAHFTTFWHFFQYGDESINVPIASTSWHNTEFHLKGNSLCREYVFFRAIKIWLRAFQEYIYGLGVWLYIMINVFHMLAYIGMTSGWVKTESSSTIVINCIILYSLP